MTCGDLKELYLRSNVPSDYYSFCGAGGGDCYALEVLDGCWNLSYYDQRGTREEKGTYPDEDAGCRAMFAAVAEMVQIIQKRAISFDV
jgi:hypothetical protein